MTNLEKYNHAFIDAFGVSESSLEGLQYQGIPEWDSVGHMGLIAAIEDAFEISFETDDIVDFSSYQKGKDLIRKYNVDL